jgi:hypothetical protein
MPANLLNLPRTSRVRTTREDLAPITSSAERSRWSFLGEYYAWSARHWNVPAGNDPLTGRPWNRYDARAQRLSRAADIAMARECYAIARTFGPMPLP